MFDKKKEVPVERINELEAEIGVLAQEVSRMREMMTATINANDGNDALMRKVHDAEDLVRGFIEHIGAEVGNMRTHWPRRFVAIEERCSLFDKMFRALGADMVVRATGGGSVAPPASKNK